MADPPKPLLRAAPGWPAMALLPSAGPGGRGISWGQGRVLTKLLACEERTGDAVPEVAGPASVEAGGEVGVGGGVAGCGGRPFGS